MKFTVGARVTRPEHVFYPSRLLHGRVIECYSRSVQKYADGFTLGPYPELYRVQWDDGRTQEGFLPHGLDKEE